MGRGRDGRAWHEAAGRAGRGSASRAECGSDGRAECGSDGWAQRGPVGRAGFGDWRVAAYEVVEGETVSGWTAADVSGLLAVAERMRERLEPCPIEGVTPYAADFVPLLGDWRRLGERRPPPYGLPVELLAELESRWTAVLVPGTALHHGDLRRDNVIREPGGRLRIVDWTHLWTAPGWMDLIRLLPDVAACGIDPEAVLRRSCWREVPDEHVNVALAGLAGRAWRDCVLPGERRLRRMQAEQADGLLAWLSARLGGSGG
nr:phosphotransferase [Actinoplanes utahensis]